LTQLTTSLLYITEALCQYSLLALNRGYVFTPCACWAVSGWRTGSLAGVTVMGLQWI